MSHAIIIDFDEYEDNHTWMEVTDEGLAFEGFLPRPITCLKS